MKKPTLIITDPKKIQEICLRQRSCSRQEMIDSILIQNGKKPISKNMKFKVIPNAIDCDQIENLDAWEAYILFSPDGKLYTYDYSDGGEPGFDFWKKVCVLENVRIEDIEFDENSPLSEGETDQLVNFFGLYEEQ